VKAAATAPGKVVILGEYAVLEGAPALVMAVNRRVRVTLEANDEPYCSVAAPGLSTATGRFRLGPAGTDWLDGDADLYRLATHAIEACFGAGDNLVPCRPFDLVLDSTALMERRNGVSVKLGLGSSAALTVALCRALGYYAASQHTGVGAPSLDRLIEIHAALQGRRGSGLDVAASLHGGLIEYRRSPAPAVAPARLPDGLDYCFVWSGQAAATGQFLAQLDRWRGDHPAAYQRVIEPLADVARAGLRAARANDAEVFLRVLGEYTTALEALGSASGADILSAPHQWLRALAGRCGVAYKPCGAGGGDIGVAIAREPGALARFRDGLAAGNFQPLSLNSEREGVETRSEN